MIISVNGIVIGIICSLKEPYLLEIYTDNANTKWQKHFNDEVIS